jgi:chromate transporter
LQASVLLLSLLQINEIVLLFGCRFVALLLYSIQKKEDHSFLKIIDVVIHTFCSKTTSVAITNFNLFLIFIKIGAILYGSGYVLLHF